MKLFSEFTILTDPIGLREKIQEYNRQRESYFVGFGIKNCRHCKKLEGKLKPLTESHFEIAFARNSTSKHYKLLWFNCSDPSDLDEIGLQPLGFPTLLFFSEGRVQNGWQGFAKLSSAQISKLISDEIT